jgi:hypothetical protein
MIFTKTKNSSILGHHYFAQKPPCTSQIKFKASWHPRSQSLASPSARVRMALQVRWQVARQRQSAKKRGRIQDLQQLWGNAPSQPHLQEGQQTGWGGRCLCPPQPQESGGRNKDSGPHGSGPLNVRRPADAAKVADLILSDNDDGLLDLKTAPASKPTAKPIVAPPPYEIQDPDIDGRNGLNGLDRLDELQGALA